MKSSEFVMKPSGMSHKEIPQAASALPGFGIFLLCILLLSSERAGLIQEYSAILSSFVLILILLYLLREFFRFRQHTLTYFYQVFYFVFLLVSAILIINGAYMIEIKKTGNPNGVFWTLALFFIAGLEVSRFSYYKGIRKFQYTSIPRIEKKLEKFVLLIIVALTLGLSLFILFKYKSPILLGIERADFWNSVVPQSLSFFPSLVFQTFFIAVALYWRKRQYKINNKLEFLILLSYFFVTFVVVGEKLSAFIVYLMIFLFFIASHTPNFRINFKIFFLVVGLISVILGLIVYSYLIIGRDAGFILVRLALQGQLNWSVLNVEYFPWATEVSWNCYWGCNSLSGVDFISHKYLPESVYEHYKASGTGLSGFFPALPILTFGLPAALLLHIFFSFFSGFIRAYLITQITHQNHIYCFLVFKVYFASILYWYAGAQYAVHSMIFGLSLFLCFILLFLKFVLSFKK